MATCYLPSLFLPDPDDDYSEPDLRRIAFFFAMNGSNFDNPDGSEYFWNKLQAVINEVKSSHSVRTKAEEIAEESKNDIKPEWSVATWSKFVRCTQLGVADTQSLFKV